MDALKMVDNITAYDFLLMLQLSRCMELNIFNYKTHESNF